MSSDEVREVVEAPAAEGGAAVAPVETAPQTTEENVVVDRPAETVEEVAANPEHDQNAPVEPAEPAQPDEDTDERYATEKEQAYKQQLADILRQIEERKAHHATITDRLATLPTREAAEALLAQTRQDLEDTEEQVEVATKTLEMLREPEDRAYLLVAKTHRLENYCTRAEDWVERTLATDVDAEIMRAKRNTELDIAIRIEELQHNRAKVLVQIDNMRKRVLHNTEQLRRGHQREPIATMTGFQKMDSPQRSAYERCTTPRPEHVDTLDPDTHRMIDANREKELDLEKTLVKVQDLARMRSDLAVQTAKHQRETREMVAKLQNEIRQQELAAAREGRDTNYLASQNAALTSTIEMIFSQLNNLHYGIDGGPVTAQLAAKQTAETPKRITTKSDGKSDTKQRSVSKSASK